MSFAKSRCGPEWAVYHPAQRTKRAPMSRRSSDTYLTRATVSRGKMYKNYVDSDASRDRSQSLSYDEGPTRTKQGKEAQELLGNRPRGGSGSAQRQEQRQARTLDVKSQRTEEDKGTQKEKVVAALDAASGSSSARRDLISQTRLSGSRPYVYPQEAASELSDHPVPPQYTHAEYVANPLLTILIRHKHFRAVKSAPLEAIRMVYYRRFDVGHNFHPGSLQNIFNWAMLRAQDRNGIKETWLHATYKTAMMEEQLDKNDFSSRDRHTETWKEEKGDFYILTEAERRIWAQRVVICRRLSVGPQKDVDLCLNARFLQIKQEADKKTIEEVRDLVESVERNKGRFDPEAEFRSDWFNAAMWVIQDVEVAEYM